MTKGQREQIIVLRNQFNEQVARAEKAEEENIWLIQRIVWYQEEIDSLHDENKHLRKALEAFIEADRTYVSEVNPFHKEVEQARALFK
jgi:hypothetical protein